MSSALARQDEYISLDEYLALEEKAEAKHEYHDGEIFAMAGGTARHADLIFNVAAAFAPRLRGHRCRGSSSEQRIYVEARNRMFYPDFLVKCPPENYSDRDPNALENPALIVEVLSESSAAFDRVEKFEIYSLIPELRDYILVDQYRILVEHYQRGEDGDSWILRRYDMRESMMRIPNLEIEIPLEEIYEGIDVPSGLMALENTNES